MHTSAGERPSKSTHCCTAVSHGLGLAFFFFGAWPPEFAPLLEAPASFCENRKRVEAAPLCRFFLAVLGAPRCDFVGEGFLLGLLCFFVLGDGLALEGSPTS